MKIIHCADIHLASKMETNLSKEKSKARRDEIFDSFIRMIEYAIKNDINHIIIAGDLFDEKKVSNTVIKRLLQIIIRANQITFYYLEGNHDVNVLDDVTLPFNLKVMKQEFNKYYIDNICIAGTSINNPAIVNFDNAFFNILILHGNVTKYKSVNSEDIYLQDYNEKNVNYFALGHIHKNEIMKLSENSVAVYCGCLEGRGFDELGEKGFYVLDISNKLDDINFVSVAKRKLYEITIDISGCIIDSDILDVIEEKLNQYSNDDLFKVVLIGKHSIDLEKNIEKLERILNTKYYFLKIVDKSKIAISYKDYENDVSLLGEFVRTVINDAELDEFDKNKILEYGIKALSNDEL